MPEYAGLFRKMPVNASGMDFTHKCRLFPNPGGGGGDQGGCEWRSEAFVKIQKKNLFFFGGGGSSQGGGGGGSG